MTSRERVIAAIRFQGPGRIPGADPAGDSVRGLYALTDRQYAANCRGQVGTMTRREQMLAVLNRAQVPRPPVCLRLNLWYADAVSSGTLPDCLHGLSVEEVQDYLGFCRAARYSPGRTLVFESAVVCAYEAGPEHIEEYRFPERNLVRKHYCDDRFKRSEMRGHITNYPLATEDDYDVMLLHMDEARVDFEMTGFSDFDEATGDAGLPLVLGASCGTHDIMLSFAGYENFYYHLHDFPGKVEQLVRRLDRIYRRDMWPGLAGSAARMVLCGYHFNSQMTPPRIFEQYFLPVFSDLNDMMHTNGKLVFFHADAEMGALIDHVLAAGFDGADCLVTAPLVPQRMEDYFEAWQSHSSGSGTYVSGSQSIVPPLGTMSPGIPTALIAY